MIPWSKKYNPENSNQIIGQDLAVKALKDFISNPHNKAALIYGPTGCGKTSSAYALANELDLEIIEINASDCRNKDQINSVVGNASTQMSLFMKQKLILIDEIDGLSGTKDRGGIQAIVKIIQNTKFPIVLTANNPFDYKFNSLRKKCEVIEFQSLTYEPVYEVLKKICKKEQIKTEDSSLKTLARRSGGDLRGAVTDLQTLTTADKILDPTSLDELSGRKQMESVLQALVKVFKTTDPDLAITAFDNIDEDLDKMFLWIDENLPREYTKANDLAEAYDKLSKADVFKGRIRRWQHWRYLIYVNTLLTAGIAVSKEKKYPNFVQYKPTGRILKLWWAKQKSMKKKAIAQKIADRTHSSKREVIKNILPYIQVMFKKDKELAKNFTKEFDLDKEEVAWLKK